jgi:hypothetical protein
MKNLIEKKLDEWTKDMNPIEKMRLENTVIRLTVFIIGALLYWIFL